MAEIEKKPADAESSSSENSAPALFDKLRARFCGSEKEIELPESLLPQEPQGMQKIFPWWKNRIRVKQPKKPFKQECVEWGMTLAAALLIAFVCRSWLFEPVRVDGDSMYPTLHHGEFMYVSKTDYGTSFIGIPFTNIGSWFTVGGNPERNDVVVCHYPGRVDGRGVPLNFVKRVIGLPGDTIQIKDGYLYVNGMKQEEKFLHERMWRDQGPWEVPEDHYFLLGDNRNHSNDSRNPDVGAVPRDFIVGKVESILWHNVPSTLEDAGTKN